MGLKTLVDSATFEDLSDDLKACYTQDGEKFVLTVDDLDTHPDVRNVVKALKETKAQRDRFKAERDAHGSKLSELPEDFDAEEYLRLKAGDKGEGKINEALSEQRKLMEQRIANLEAKHADELKIRDEEIADQNNHIDSGVRESALGAAMNANSIAPQFQKSVKALLSQDIKVLRDDNGQRRAVFETDLGETDVNKFVENWAQSDDGKHFVVQAKGPQPNGGAHQGSSSSRISSEALMSMDHTERRKALLEDKKTVVD